MRGRHLRIFGVLVALVGVMAVGASAAQAEWLLLKSKVSVLELKFNTTTGLGKLLVPKLGLTIHCTGGSGPITISTDTTHKVLTGSGTITYTGCTIEGNPEKCTVHSKGAANGTIVAKGSGTGFMEGEAVLAELSSSEFTFIEIGGALCPLNEENGAVNGKAHLLLLEPLVDASTHMAHLLSLGLFYGKQEAKLDGTVEGLQLFEVTDAGGNPWAIHLVNL